MTEEHGKNASYDATIPRRASARQGETRSDRARDEGQGPAEASQRRPIARAGRTHRGGSGEKEDDPVLRIVIAEEGTRASGFALMCMMTSVMTLGFLKVLKGDPVARGICAVALVAIFVVSAWMWKRVRSPNPNVIQIMRVFGIVVVNGTLAVEYFMGFFSPVTVILSIAVYYVGMSRDTHFATGFAAHLILGWSTGASLIAFGVIEDRGIYPLLNQPSEHVGFVIIAVTLTLLSALFAARQSRQALWDAVETAHKALVRADNRDALLAEAQNQLDRAMRLSVGQPGRYTGRMAGERELKVLIGFGAMGEVYLAEDPRDASTSAVKLLRTEALEEGKLVDRFVREASICQRLMHPNVVRVTEVGQIDGDAPYMAMELLHGRDLSEILRKQNRLPWSQVIELAQSLAGALDHAHSAGVIHRDLKPHNIFQTRQADGQQVWKILDFGISKLLSSAATLTQDGVVGTPSYMSPEQAQARTVDQRSDIFAMAAVIYRAATGRPAFAGKDTPAIMFNVVYRMPQRPSAVYPELPKLLDAVLAIGLAKWPEERFQTAGALAQALAETDLDAVDELLLRAQRVLDKTPWTRTETEREDRSGAMRAGALRLGPGQR